MCNTQNEDYAYCYEKKERDRALEALEQMKVLEEQRKNQMRTIALQNGAVVSHTNDETLEQFKKVGKNIFRV